METVAYLGPEGSYSYLAAKKLRPEALYNPYRNFRLVMKALLNGECDCFVAPIENSLNGGVVQNIDLLQSTYGVSAVAECTVPIDHRLARLEGAEGAQITRIYSHQQALDQCGEYLATHFPYAEQIATLSTAACLDKIKLPTDAGIVGAHTVRAGITLSPRNIADDEHNFTQFLLIAREDVAPDKKCEKIYFSVTCRHEPGALIKLLKPLSDGGLNMTKIGSRPIKDKPGEYRFFIELEGDLSEKYVRDTLGGVRRAARSFRLLGAY